MFFVKENFDILLHKYENKILLMLKDVKLGKSYRLFSQDFFELFG